MSHTNATTASLSTSTLMELDLFFNPYDDQVGINVLVQVWTIAIAVVGTVGNVMVIAAVVLHSHLRKLGNVFIVNLALADLGVSFVVNIASFAVSVSSEAGFFYRYPWMCELVAIICMMTCTCSLWSIAAIALNRYVWICHWQSYTKIFNRRTIPFMIMTLWFISFLIDLPNMLGWGVHSFDWKIMSCTGGMSFVYSYAIFFAMTAFAAPLLIIAYSYIGIFRFVRKAARAIDSIREKSGGGAAGRVNYAGPKISKTRAADIRLARSVLAIVIAYLVMWTPYSLTVLIDHRVVADRKLYIVAYTLAHTNSSINCLIYGATNAQFRRGYAHFLRLITCRAKTSDLLMSVTGTATATAPKIQRKTTPVTLDNSLV